MNIQITGRNIRVSDNQKEFAEKKIKKLETYFQQLMDSHVILSVEKLDHMAEVLINGDGVQFHGTEKSGDFFSAIDLLIEKMENQIRKYKEKHSAHKGPDKSEIGSMKLLVNEGNELVMRQTSSKPIDKIEAYLQMKLNNANFILFKVGENQVNSEVNYLNKNYAVLYRDTDGLKLVEIPFEMIKEHNFDSSRFQQYELNIVEDSTVNPKIIFKAVSHGGIKEATVEDAFKEAVREDISVYPFFNLDTNYLNVLYKNGKDYEVMVPAY